MNVNRSDSPLDDYELRWRFPAGRFFAAWFVLVTAANGLAATHYVDLNSVNPAPPYTNWATAATVIQDAVDAAAAGDDVVVTNGIYATGGRPVGTNLLSNRVTVEKPITLHSANGPLFTVIRGYQVPTNILGDAAVRCVYLAGGAVLSGFTLTNGATRGNSTSFTSDFMGAGVWCESASAVVSNCTLTGNCALGGGGGAGGGTLNNCTLSGNSASGEGGGANGSTLNNCVLSDNLAGTYFGQSANVGYGGGVAGCTLNNCTVSGNSASYGGGAAGCTLNNCTLADNWAFGGANLQGYVADGIGGGAFDSTLTYCTLTANSADGAGGGAAASSLDDCTFTGNSAGSDNGFGGYYGYGGGVAGGTLNNCTLTGNWAPGGGGASPYYNQGFFYEACTANNCTFTDNGADDGGGAFEITLNNCILYFNSVSRTNFDNYGNYASCYSFTNCCTIPLPSGPGDFGNITNTPLFVALDGGNLRLQSNSPCINAGNNSYVTNTTDLDGRPRIVSGTVDIGAYEFQGAGTGEFIGWLQQYGLPTDGSADFTDPDADGMNNWQEWRCGTNPTNALSALRLLAPTVTGTNVVVRWQSVAGVNYFVERSTNLAQAAVFMQLATNFPGQSGTTTYSDTNATGTGPFYYRVGVTK